MSNRPKRRKIKVTTHYGAPDWRETVSYVNEIWDDASGKWRRTKQRHPLVEVMRQEEGQ